ncbi:MAG: YceI family protein [Niabella sp.]|nr:MAG: YceI family protein [Niabella sp.]
MENKNNTLLLAVGLVVLAGGIYFTYTQNSNTSTQNGNSESTVLPAATVAETTVTPSATPNPEDMGKYLVKSGEASYTVNKKFVGKPAGKVTGSTSSVTGKGEYDETKGTLSLKAEVDITALKTDSDMRDADVRKIFGENKTATFMVNDFAVKKDANIDTSVKGNLTLNNVTKPVEFKITGTWNENTVNVEGMTTINMQDYNITPPSVVNVYTVDPMTELKFKVIAELNQ